MSGFERYGIVELLRSDPAIYVGGWGGSPYSWHGTFPVAGGTFTITDSNGGVYPNVVITRTATSVTTWTNHGD